jgi:peptidoglycan hydrolase-like protein with peptidoglycan-binding domain
MRRIAAPHLFLLAALACALVLLVGGEALAQDAAGRGEDAGARGKDASAGRGTNASGSIKATASQSRREVRRLQRKLGVPADGVFGPQTKRAVKRFQRRHGLVADGVVGPVTRSALGLGAGPVLKRERRGGGQGPARRAGRRSARQGGGGVRALQRALGIPADGVFGPQTESAVRRFQRSHGLTADGVVGPDTRRALGLGSGDTLKRSGGSEGGGEGGGGGGDTLQRLISAANRIAEMPYRFGGGHRSFDDSGYDCSGSLSYALHGAGLLKYALDSSGFMSYGEPGPGRHVTIYAHGGHAFMVVDGRRYDTSALRETGSRWTSKPRSTSGFVVRHPPGL